MPRRAPYFALAAIAALLLAPGVRSARAGKPPAAKLPLRIVDSQGNTVLIGLAASPSGDSGGAGSLGPTLALLGVLGTALVTWLTTRLNANADLRLAQRNAEKEKDTAVARVRE